MWISMLGDRMRTPEIDGGHGKSELHEDGRFGIVAMEVEEDEVEERESEWRESAVVGLS